MEIIENRIMDEERALYGQTGLRLRGCAFEGPADGESALKECRDIAAADTVFRLRYPCWHDRGVELRTSEMTETCRAPLWYSSAVRIRDCKLRGVKALRECRDVEITGSDIVSPEFGWFCRDVTLRDSSMEGEYFLLRSENVRLDRVHFTGKYAFQYVKGGLLTDCVLDTKDAFWHTEGLTVRNCVVRGEYLGWYSHNLTLIDCEISGTQPLCYCTGLRLINCRMSDADLSFERSEVRASLTAPILSIKNPLSGVIYVPEVGELIRDIPEALGEVRVGEIAPEGSI